MDKRLIKKLVEAGYVDHKLDADRVNKIAEHLTRLELKEYIKALKERRKRLTVYIDSSFELPEQFKKELEDLFVNKEVIFRKDSNLMLGIRITENDIVYNLNLQNSLQQIKGYFEKYL